MNIHEYLDNALIEMARYDSFSIKKEDDIFQRTFTLLDRSLNKKAFKKWDGKAFKGRFLMSVFEVIAIGVSKNIDRIEEMKQTEQDEFVIEKSKALWSDKVFLEHSSNVSGIIRLARLLPIAEDFLKP